MRSKVLYILKFQKNSLICINEPNHTGTHLYIPGKDWVGAVVYVIYVYASTANFAFLLNMQN